MNADDTDARRPGSIGNQNARRHGWYSKVNPPTKQELMAGAETAVAEQDHTELRAIGRAMGFHGRRLDDPKLQRAGRNVVKLARRLEAANAEKEAQATINRHLAELRNTAS